MLVKLGLTAQSQSPLRAPYLALHLTNTLLLLAALTLTAHFLSREVAICAKPYRSLRPSGASLGIVVLLVVGVTGSLAALGDTLFPAHSLSSALAQDFATAATGWCAGAGRIPLWRFSPAFFSSGCWCAPRSAAHWDNRALSALVLILLAAQYVLGVLDVFLLAPVWLQIAHLLGADACGPRWWCSPRG